MNRPRAVLVGVLTPDRTHADLSASLDELGRLCDTLGLEPVGRLTQRRPSTRGAQLLGSGQLKVLAEWTGGPGYVYRGPRKNRPRPGDGEPEDQPLSLPEPPEPGGNELDQIRAMADAARATTDASDGEARATGALEEDALDSDALEEDALDSDAPSDGARAEIVVVDSELSPSQLRNLKSATGVEVLDRNGVIIEIFHQRARSREARLQVELARLAYLAPRLREVGGPSERQRGGIGGKGAGESSLELDRRKVRDQMAAIRRDLKAIEVARGTRRVRRSEVRQIALVGYTNAGKSSLMRGLTGAAPYVADQLFATLDTTVRKLSPPATPPILVTDTVGFIKDLPHSLVASFRSTLDAALEAGLLLHVVDASDPTWREQEVVTADVLAEIQADDLHRVLVFNKIDRLDAEALEALRAERPDAWFTSAHEPDLVLALRDRIAEWFATRDPEIELFVPWSKSSLMGLVHARAHVISEDFEDEGVRYRLRAPTAAAAQLKSALREG